MGIDWVFSALLELNGNKNLGLDGFSIELQLGFCEKKGDEVFQIVFWTREIWEQCYLVLIPKNEGAQDLKDFRPISLVGGLYKILAKVLAKRL